MRFLWRTFVVCFLLLFISSTNGGLFDRNGPKSTSEPKGASDTWGAPYLRWVPEVKFSIPSFKLPLGLLTGNADAKVATTIQNPTTESSVTHSSIITTQDYTVSLEAQVATAMQNPVTESSLTSTNIITTQDHTMSSEAQVSTTVQIPTTESSLTSSNIITKQDAVALEALVATTIQDPMAENLLTSPDIYQTITVQTEETQTTPVQIGTLLPQRGNKPPKDYLLRGTKQTGKSKPLSKPGLSYDLEIWPPNKDSHTEKNPQTEPHPVSPQATNEYGTVTSSIFTQEASTFSTQLNWRNKQTTTSTEMQDAKTKSPKNDQITTTGFQSAPSEPRLMTTPEKVIQSTATQPGDSTSEPSKDTTQLQLSLSTALEVSLSPQQVEEDTAATATMHSWTLETEAPNGTPDRFPWLVPTTSVPEGGHFSSNPDFTHAPLNTASTAGGKPR